MICPHCGSGKTAIIDSRECGWDGETVRRRRRCQECRFRFSSFEITEEEKEEYERLLAEGKVLEAMNQCVDIIEKAREDNG